jgi:cystathionine beta-lyase
MSPEAMDLSHILNHLGEDRELYYGAAAPVLVQSTNFVFPTLAELRAALAEEMDRPFYTRGHNPTVATLRKKLAALEGTEDCLVFGSGSAAVAAAVLSSVEAGSHIVCVRKPYSWTHKLLTQFLPRFGVETTFVDGSDPESFRSAIRPSTRLIYLESPNSLTFELQDIAAVAAIAREHGIATAIDNSYASPLNQQPAAWGIDMIIHSASKYLGGHSDVVAGVLCCSRARAEQVFRSEYMTLGGILSPHDAWLILRGLRTLPLRIERVAESTPKVVRFLESHPGVERVYYPFSPSHPQHALALRQMRRPAGQFSILLRAARPESVEVFCNSLERFLMGASWGGYESLAFPMAALLTSANYQNRELPWNLVRFYVGLEEPDLLIADLAQALECMLEAGRA